MSCTCSSVEQWCCCFNSIFFGTRVRTCRLCVVSQPCFRGTSVYGVPNVWYSCSADAHAGLESYPPLVSYWWAKMLQDILWWSLFLVMSSSVLDQVRLQKGRMRVRDCVSDGNWCMCCRKFFTCSQAVTVIYLFIVILLTVTIHYVSFVLQHD